MLAHARQGLLKVYDHHDYFEEKREALALWQAQLRAIVEAHGGRIWLENAAPGATEFRFVIPASPETPQGNDIGSS